MKPREFYVGSHLIICDESMIAILGQYTWHVFKSRSTFYAATNVRVGGKQHRLTMHRLLSGMRSGIVDHRNRNGLDNRLENLRFASAGENSCNRVRKNSFGFRGVYKPKNSSNFAVQIQAGKVKIHKRGFLTAEEAAREYDKLSKEHHGEFGIRNFED